MTNVMVDLETMDTRASSVILSIGAVAFDVNGLHEEFYAAVRLKGQEKRTWSPDTLLWWIAQSEEARLAAFVSLPRISIEEALIAFKRYVEPGVKIWGNGSDFDNAILQDAYAAYGYDCPWKFWNNRCFRTFKDGRMSTVQRSDQHNALADAKYQAACMVEWLQKEQAK